MKRYSAVLVLFVFLFVQATIAFAVDRKGILPIPVPGEATADGKGWEFPGSVSADAVYVGGAHAAIAIEDKYHFDDDAARTAYFVANPTELIDGRCVVIMGVGEIQRYDLDTTSWVSISTALRGPTGADGADGADGEPYTISPDVAITNHADVATVGTIAWAVTNYEKVLLGPGTYPVASGGTISLPSGHALYGAGSHTTVIERTGATASLIDLADNSEIADIGLNFNRTLAYGEAVAAVQISGATDIYNQVRNVRIVATGAGANGISLGNGNARLVNCEILTEGVGITQRYAGNMYYYDCDIRLIGTNVGVDHTGLRINVGDGGRAHWYGGFIGTGYGTPEITGDTTKQFAAIRAVSTAGAGRLTCYNLTSFVRIDDGADSADLANVYLNESSQFWARFFGSFGQSEIPSGTAAWASEAIRNAGGGQVEVYGSRFTGTSGPVFGGAGDFGVRTISASESLQKYEGGLILIDATSDDVTITMEAGSGPRNKGHGYLFKRIDASENAVTITATGTTIDGAAAIPLAPYDSLLISYTGMEFSIVSANGQSDEGTGDMLTDVYDLDEDGVIDVTALPVLDEDNMQSDSAVHGASQQSIKAYVDNGLANKESAQPSRLELTADTSINAAQLLANKYIVNQGASSTVKGTLPAVSYSVTRTIVVEEVQIFQLAPPSGEAFDLDGTTLTADQVVESGAVPGDKIVATRMKDASGAWTWSLDTVRGSWAAVE
jgi:hypothetical protein